jgi:cytochrome c553
MARRAQAARTIAKLEPRMRAILLLALSLYASGAAAAEEASADAGHQKAAVCAACHGPDGNSVNPEWPSLAGQHARYVARQIDAFKSGNRSNPLMAGIAAGLTPQDAADLGAYYSSLSITVGEADPALVHAGERLYRGGNRAKGLSACIACHGPDGRGNQPGGIPALGGQHAQYTAAQLKAYAAGERRSDPNQIMRNIAALMSPEEIAAVASYVQGLH